MKNTWKALGAIIIVAIVVLGLWSATAPHDKYKGFVTRVDVEFGPGEKELLEQQLAVLEQSLQQQEDAGGEIDSKLYVDIAQVANTLGDLVKAREMYELYFDYNVLDLAPRLNYGRVLLEMEDYKGAEEAYKQVLASGGAYEGTFRGLLDAITEQNQEGKRDQDIKNTLDVATEIVGQTPWLMAQLAEWYNAHGDCHQAIAHLQVIVGIAESEDARNAARQDIADLERTCKRQGFW